MAGRRTSDPALPLGIRKMLRLLSEDGKSPSKFAAERGVDRFKLMRVLRGEMRRIDIDFIGKLIRGWPPGTLEPLDFAQSTVDVPDTGASSRGKLRAVAGK